MSRFVNTKILLGGRDFSSQPLLLRQAIDGHHHFEVHLRYDTAQKGQLLREAQALVGEKAEIDIRWEIRNDLGINLPEAGSANRFFGLVTEVRLDRGAHRHNEIIISGQSPVNLLDDGPQVRSFSEKSLQHVTNTIVDPLKEVLARLGLSFNAQIDPAQMDSQPYLVQYNESDFAFLRRLAARFGEWFFYDGENLIFGKLPQKDVLPLKFDSDLLDFKLSVKAAPVNFKIKAYDYTQNKFNEVKPEYQVDKLDEYSRLALEKSKDKLFPNEPFSSSTRNMNEAELTMYVKKRSDSRLNDLVFLSGSSINPHLRIGSLISLSDPKIKPTQDDYGTYLVTHLMHDFSDVNEYRNYFQAIPAKGQPSPQVHAAIPEPFCDSQLARVVDVNDAKGGLGRVKVKFPWQEGSSETTPWVRVVAPQASGDRGLYFVPEIGDQVVVNFEYNDPEKPFVAGSMYHSEAAPSIFKNAQNLLKGIKTISGNQVLFDDTQGMSRIQINTPGGANQILLTMEEGNMIRITTQGNFLVYAENSIKIEAKKDISIKAKNMKIELEEKFSLASEETEIKVNEKYALSANETDVTANNKYSLNSKEISIKADSGYSSESGGNTIIKGNPIHLNP